MICPMCGTDIEISDDVILSGEISCPNCKLEFKIMEEEEAAVEIQEKTISILSFLLLEFVDTIKLMEEFKRYIEEKQFNKLELKLFLDAIDAFQESIEAEKTMEEVM